MEQDSSAVKPLTPNLTDESYYRPQRFVDFKKHVTWLKNFEHYPVPAGHTIKVKEQSNDDIETR